MTSGRTTRLLAAGAAIERVASVLLSAVAAVQPRPTQIAPKALPSVIGGSRGNFINTIGAGATIGGGFNNDASSTWATISGGHHNDALEMNATVGGGFNNGIGGGSPSGVIAGGSDNLIGFGAEISTIGGGSSNLIETGSGSTIGGGWNNHTQGQYATVSGGRRNEAFGPLSTISGGDSNFVYYPGAGGTIGGGFHSSVRGEYAVIGGGGGAAQADSNSAQGEASVIGGGRGNYINTIGTGATIALPAHPPPAAECPMKLTTSGQRLQEDVENVSERAVRYDWRRSQQHNWLRFNRWCHRRRQPENVIGFSARRGTIAEEKAISLKRAVQGHHRRWSRTIMRKASTPRSLAEKRTKHSVRYSAISGGDSNIVFFSGEGGAIGGGSSPL